MQGKSRSYLPVILKIRFGDLVTLVVTVLCRILRKTLDESLRIVGRIKGRFNQKIGESISSAVCQIVVGQEALFVAGGGADGIVILITLVVHILRSELKSVFADRFAHVVTQGIGWTGVAPWHVGGICGKTSATIGCICAQKIDSRILAAKAVVEDVAHRALRETCHWVSAQYRIALSGS